MFNFLGCCTGTDRKPQDNKVNDEGQAVLAPERNTKDKFNELYQSFQFEERFSQRFNLENDISLQRGTNNGKRRKKGKKLTSDISNLLNDSKLLQSRA